MLNIMGMKIQFYSDFFNLNLCTDVVHYLMFIHQMVLNVKKSLDHQRPFL